MRRFWVPSEQITAERAIIIGEDAYHLHRVLRLKKNEQILVFDGTGREYLLLLEEVSEKQVSGKIIETSFSSSNSPILITLVQGIPKGEKMDLIIQKATELGVAKIVPVLTSRTVVKLDQDKKMKRLLRWQSIAKEACKQCGRVLLPEIAPIQNLEEYLETIDLDDQCLVFWEGEHSCRVQDFLKQYDGDQIIAFIGPEGGFALPEVEKIKEKKASSVSLGQRILRTETAALVAIALIQYELGDLG